MADQLLAADIDLLLYVDPTKEAGTLGEVKSKFGGRLAVAGGVSNVVTLHGGSHHEIRQAVEVAIEQLGPTGFIPAPVRSLDPDTPWASVEALIELEFRN